MCAEGEEHMCDKGMTGTYDAQVINEQPLVNNVECSIWMKFENLL